MTTKTAQRKATAVKPVAVTEVDPAYSAGAFVRETAVATVVTTKDVVVDTVSFIGSKLFNFGKGLFNVHPAH